MLAVKLATLLFLLGKWVLCYPLANLMSKTRASPEFHYSESANKEAVRKSSGRSMQNTCLTKHFANFSLLVFWHLSSTLVRGGGIKLPLNLRWWQ